MRESATLPARAQAASPTCGATQRRKRKFLVAAIVALAPIAVTGTAWANGCVCG